MNKHIVKAKLKQASGRYTILRGNLSRRRSKQLSGRVELTAGQLNEKYWRSRLGISRLIKRRVKSKQPKSFLIKTGIRSK